MVSKIPVIGGIGAAVAGIVFVLFFTPTGISQDEYSLSVDPTKEKQSLFIKNYSKNDLPMRIAMGKNSFLIFSPKYTLSISL